jgi:hypothetical protein
MWTPQRRAIEPKGRAVGIVIADSWRGGAVWRHDNRTFSDLGKLPSRASAVKIGWNRSPTGFSAASLLRTRLGVRPASEFEIFSTGPG